MARCLVTGHKGYIGSKLFSKLKQLGHDVHGVDIETKEISERLFPSLIGLLNSSLTDCIFLNTIFSVDNLVSEISS